MRPLALCAASWRCSAASLSANRWRLPTHLPSLRTVVTRTYRLSAIDFLRRHLTSKMTHDAKLPLPAGHIAVKNYNHRDLKAFYNERFECNITLCLPKIIFLMLNYIRMYLSMQQIKVCFPHCAMGGKCMREIMKEKSLAKLAPYGQTNKSPFLNDPPPKGSRPAE